MNEERSIYSLGSGAIGILEAEIVKRDAEIARLRTDLAGVVAELRQALSEIEAERAARMRAEATERERCAQVAEGFIPSGFTSDGKAGNTYAVARDDRARVIAAAIRDMKDERRKTNDEQERYHDR